MQVGLTVPLSWRTKQMYLDKRQTGQTVRSHPTICGTTCRRSTIETNLYSTPRGSKMCICRRWSPLRLVGLAPLRRVDNVYKLAQRDILVVTLCAAAGIHSPVHQHVSLLLLRLSCILEPHLDTPLGNGEQEGEISPCCSRWELRELKQLL